MTTSKGQTVGVHLCTSLLNVVDDVTAGSGTLLGTPLCGQSGHHVTRGCHLLRQRETFLRGLCQRLSGVVQLGRHLLLRLVLRIHLGREKIETRLHPRPLILLVLPPWR
jgi:hypothetical protein